MSGAAAGIGVMSGASGLFAEPIERVDNNGPITGRWGRSTIYQFNRPLQPRWDVIESLSLIIIVQSGDASTVVGDHRLTGEVNYVVAGAGCHFDCQILQASIEHQVLCLVVPIDPQLVRSVVTSVRSLGMAGATRELSDRQQSVSVADVDMANAISRFLRSLRSQCDRRILAPLLVQEMVYRALQGQQGHRLMQLAAHQATAHPVGAALAYIEAHLAEPLSVEALAARVWLSPSSFSRIFRETTGCGPYQYVKEARLDRARQLLDDGSSTVAEAARHVGYISVSNFIKAFRRRFGVTPGDYANAHPFRRAG